MLLGCVQPAMMPNINSATARVLDAAGIQTLVADGAGCCGAIREHLGDHDGGLADMRRNIDAWWPLVDGLTVDGRVEAIVMNASGCGVTVKEYGQALAHDPAYADKAARVSALTRDLSRAAARPAAGAEVAPGQERRHGRPGVSSALHAAAWPAAARRRRGRPARARF
jgi:glycolate oxidase iron-sulfur subunit